MNVGSDRVPDFLDVSRYQNPLEEKEPAPHVDHSSELYMQQRQLCGTLCGVEL